MSDKLFEDFNSVSSKHWKHKIQYDLKGADYNETLIWNTNEDISVKPFYHSDDINFNEFQTARNEEWKICQSIYVSNSINANLKAINAIERGAECIKFIIPNDTISISELIQNIDFDTLPLCFELHFLSEDFITNLSKSISKSSIFINGISIQIDIIGNLVRTGNWFNNLKDDFTKLNHIVSETKSITIDSSIYQNAGANMVQQLAYSISHANEYFNYFEGNSNNINSIEVNFNVAIGTNYFFEIAKLRALRLLYDVLAAEYKFKVTLKINATPTKRNKTLYDYNTNMLRTTTECMSAVLGGADTITNLAYDAIYHKDNEFGERIARNQLLILKHESYFGKVNNASDGSYYIESLTNQLAEKALELFKNLEANGGFLKQLKTGTIQRKIKEAALKEQEQFNLGQEALIGTNKHPNTNDKMKEELELYPFVKIKPRKTLIEPIIEKRLAETLEQERLNKE